MTGAGTDVVTDGLSAVPRRPRTRTTLGVTWRSVGPAALAGGVWGAAWFGPDTPVVPFAAACSILLTAAVLAAARVVGAEPGRRGAAVLLATAAMLWPLNSLGGWNVGPTGLLRALGEGLFWVTLPAAVFLYQHPRLAWPERTYLVASTVQYVGGLAACVVVSRPEWYGFAAHVWWPSVSPDRAGYDSLCRVLECFYLLNAVVFTGLIWSRRRRSAALDRHSVAPMLTAVGIAALATGVSWTVYGRTTVVVALVLLPLPVAFVFGSLRLSRLRVKLGEALDTAPAAAGAVAGALREVLRDPTVVVRFWSPEARGWVDEAGRWAARPALGDDRWRVAVSRRDGRVSAEVDTVAASPSARRGVEAAVRVAGVAIENAGLRALVRVQLEAARRAHERTLHAGVEERRRLERDLHDGAQQRLHGVLIAVARARHGTDQPDVVRQLDHVRSEVRSALAELRELANGLHPSVLARDGLEPALDEVLGRLELPSHLDVDLTAPVAESTEAAIYFVVCEAVTNIVKHACADQVWVRIVERPAGIVLDIADDGVGGANLDGHGMQGMADRIVALGGSFTAHSDPGRGTSLNGVLPRVSR